MAARQSRVDSGAVATRGLKLFKIELKTHSSDSGSWRCYPGGGKRSENRDSIK